MWTKENRRRYARSSQRYESDLMDEEWAEIAPLIPPAKPGGNKRTVNLREVVNGLMYILSTGCQWRAIPKDLPTRSTIYDYFDRWSWDGTLEKKCGLADQQVLEQIIDRLLFGQFAAEKALQGSKRRLCVMDGDMPRVVAHLTRWSNDQEIGTIVQPLLAIRREEVGFGRPGALESRLVSIP
jgi:transposase